MDDPAGAEQPERTEPEQDQASADPADGTSRGIQPNTLSYLNRPPRGVAAAARPPRKLPWVIGFLAALAAAGAILVWFPSDIQVPGPPTATDQPAIYVTPRPDGFTSPDVCQQLVAVVWADADQLHAAITQNAGARAAAIADMTSDLTPFLDSAQGPIPLFRYGRTR